MSKNDIFRTALVKKPKRARFDFSHSNTLGIKIGCGIPTLAEFIVPGDEVAMSMNQVARLAPMPVPTFANLKVRHDFFFVPCRLMYNEQDMAKIFGSAGSSSKERASLSIPDFYKTFFNAELGPDILSSYGDAPVPGSLFDYLGYPVADDVNGNTTLSSILTDYIDGATRIWGQNDVGTYVRQYVDEEDAVGALQSLNGIIQSANLSDARLNIEPLIAYHFIYRDWYRFTGIEDGTNPLVLQTDPAFKWLENHVLSNLMASNGGSFPVSSADSLVSDYATSDFVHGYLTYGELGQLFQVHLAKDMFFSARYGSKPTVLIPTGENANIPTLREASAIQRFIDLVSIVGSRYYDKIRALFNVKADGFADDRVQFLSRYQQYIKIGEVLTTSTTEQAKTGDYAGRGILIDGKYLFKRRFTEPGWLMCITSVVPDIAYTGLPRKLTDTYYIDTPVPALAEIGDQSILNREVQFSFNEYSQLNDSSFGDQFRYYAYKSANNEVHGSFRMKSMRSWVPTQDYMYIFNVLGSSRVDPLVWNKIFNDTADEPVYGDRFFFKLDFSTFITRQLPKYINYHL